MTLDDFLEEIEVWPENQPAIDLFIDLGSQWRVGPSGPTGFDYSPLFTRMDRMRLTDEAWEALFQDVRVLERVALQTMNKKA